MNESVKLHLVKARIARAERLGEPLTGRIHVFNSRIDYIVNELNRYSRQPQHLLDKHQTIVKELKYELFTIIPQALHLIETRDKTNVFLGHLHIEQHAINTLKQRISSFQR